MKLIQLLMIGFLFTIPEVLDAQNSTVPWFALSGGFTSTSAQFGRMMLMSAGQSFVGVSSGQSRIVETGFLTNPLFGNAFVVGVPVSVGWNMISNPLTRANDSVRMVFPTALSPYAFAFVSGTGYVQQYRMTNGVGFWEKFPSSITESVSGNSRLLDSIPVSIGWNMIGSISYPVDTSTIVTVPPGIRASYYFGYNGGYTAAPVMVPGKAYWVKSSASGRFVLSSNFLAKPSMLSATDFDWLNTITIADAEGGSQTLYFGEDVDGVSPVKMLAMPPLAPQGAFDARFETADGGSMVQTYQDATSGTEFTVSIQSEAYPLTVSWTMNGSPYKLSAGLATRQMTGQGTMKIASSDVNRLLLKLISDGNLPKEFALAQNFPNPFNPSTTIKYDLPKDSRVSLIVFSILGQEVATLVSEEQKAGYKSAEWNASSVASGVYFYRLDAGSYTNVKKLLLLK